MALLGNGAEGRRVLRHWFQGVARGDLCAVLWRGQTE
jgi:hypothetical protein